MSDDGKLAKQQFDLCLMMIMAMMCVMMFAWSLGADMQKAAAARGTPSFFELLWPSTDVYHIPLLVSKRRNFARRTLKLPLEARDREDRMSVDTEARVLKEAQREEARSAGIVSFCEVFSSDIQVALEKMADFPQPDGSFVHITSHAKEFAGFWIDGGIELVYSGMTRPAGPLDMPASIIARFSAPRETFRRLLALNVLRIPE